MGVLPARVRRVERRMVVARPRTAVQGHDERFPRRARVRKRRDFKRAQRLGRRISLGHVVLLLARSSGDEGQGGSPVGGARPAPGRAAADEGAAHLAAASPAVDAPAQAGARLGIVASRRVGNAVVRNRVKRRLREWFRRRRGELPAGIDLLIIVRPGAGAVGSDELHAELDRALGEIARRSRKL